MFIGTIFSIARKWTQSRCALTDKSIMEMWYINKMLYRYYENFRKIDGNRKTPSY